MEYLLTYLGGHVFVLVLVRKDAVTALVLDASHGRDSLSGVVKRATREGTQAAGRIGKITGGGHVLSFLDGAAGSQLPSLGVSPAHGTRYTQYRLNYCCNFTMRRSLSLNLD